MSGGERSKEVGGGGKLPETVGWPDLKTPET